MNFRYNIQFIYIIFALPRALIVGWHINIYGVFQQNNSFLNFHFLSLTILFTHIAYSFVQLSLIHKLLILLFISLFTLHSLRETVSLTLFLGVFARLFCMKHGLSRIRHVLHLATYRHHLRPMKSIIHQLILVNVSEQILYSLSSHVNKGMYCKFQTDFMLVIICTGLLRLFKCLTLQITAAKVTKLVNMFSK